ARIGLAGAEISPVSIKLMPGIGLGPAHPQRERGSGIHLEAVGGIKRKALSPAIKIQRGILVGPLHISQQEAGESKAYFVPPTLRGRAGLVGREEEIQSAAGSVTVDLKVSELAPEGKGMPPFDPGEAVISNENVGDVESR